jgi:hypothetical protein
MPNPQANLQLIRMLSERLERISVDSIWAHRASGVRGALLRQIEMIESDLPYDGTQLNTLTAIGFRILEESMSKRNSVR